VALIVVGPERLPELARSVGRVLRQFREVQDEVRNMVSSGVDDDIRDAAAEFRKVTGSITRATDVKGAVRRVERSIQEATVPSPTRPRADDDEAGEAGGPPADRLVEDAAANPESPARPSEPPPAADPAEPADQTEPEAPSQS
jgi:sec-independent protein translocase protein TatB